jgi:hypothetical protein
MLYWAEGTKARGTEITNSDPNIIVFMTKWLKNFFDISPDNLVVQMHIHSGQNEGNMRQYWSRITAIPLDNFQKSFIKPEGSGHRKRKLYYGTIKIRVRGQNSTYLLFQILGAISEYTKITLSVNDSIQYWIPKPNYA